jgi:serine/threonine-protein phosphatase 2A regulatory subunit B
MEFDYLKSVEIEPRVSKIRWLAPGSATQRRLLSCNDKTIKLWKIGERSQREYTQVPGSLSFPKINRRTTNPVARPLRTFANGHAYQINGLSMNSDQETFISSDDLRINLWHTGNKNEAFRTAIRSGDPTNHSNCSTFSRRRFET